MANKEKSGFSKMIQSKAFKGVSIAVASALIGAGVTYLATNNNSETTLTNTSEVEDKNQTK